MAHFCKKIKAACLRKRGKPFTLSLSLSTSFFIHFVCVYLHGTAKGKNKEKVVSIFSSQIKIPILEKDSIFISFVNALPTLRI